MAYLKSKRVLLPPGLLLVAMVFSACNNSDRPVAPGSNPSYVPQNNCTGVLGNNTVGNQTTTSNDLFFYPQAPVTNTTLVSLSIYTASTVPVTFEAGIYSNNTGSPLSLLIETGPQTVSGPATMWNTVSLVHPLSLSAGVTYWLAYQSGPSNAVPDQYSAP
ncbi:MAG TPA: hypothetical protein VK859_04980, partial [bacterium]|nr:hypothetical protein [bacterium]